MKFKFIHEISVIQETFLVFLACPEGRIKLLRGPDPARGLCIPAIHQPLALQYFRNCLPVPAPGITIPLTFTSSGNALTSTSWECCRFWTKLYKFTITLYLSI